MAACTPLLCKQNLPLLLWIRKQARFPVQWSTDKHRQVLQCLLSRFQCTESGWRQESINSSATVYQKKQSRWRAS